MEKRFCERASWATQCGLDDAVDERGAMDAALMSLAFAFMLIMVLVRPSEILLDGVRRKKRRKMTLSRTLIKKREKTRDRMSDLAII